jgi:cellulose synthase/poly-beta-1,6-N-acetylglucosamine synthase-like glycosyltransferase
MNLWIISLFIGFVLSIPFFIRDLGRIQKGRGKGRGSRSDVSKLNLSVSIIIPAWNEERHLEKCLESVIAQDYEPKEMIVVAGGDDRTFDIAKRFEQSVKVLKQDPLGKNAALNKGVKNSTGEIIVILDADCVAPKGWLKQLVMPFSQREIMIVAGTWKSRDSTIYAKNAEIYKELSFLFNKKGFWGSNTAFRKSILERINFFDENVFAGVEYDLYLTMRGVIDDTAIYMNTDAFVYTQWPQSFSSFFKANIRWARAQLEILKKHGVLKTGVFPFFISIYLIFTPFMYIFVGKLALFLWIFILGWDIFRKLEYPIILAVGTQKIEWLKYSYVLPAISIIKYITNTVAVFYFLVGKKQSRTFEHGR